MYTIALSAGHGENTWEETGGKGVPGLEEHHFNAAVAGYAEGLLLAQGFEVVQLQPLYGDYVPLRQRTQLARERNADILLAFHADANQNRQAQGHWVFYWYSDDEARRLARIWDSLADEILPNADRNTYPSKPGHWSNFHMCRVPAYYGIPAILIEHAFMTNPNDLDLLKSDGFRRKCAEVATRAVCGFFNLEYRGGLLLLKDWQRDMGEDALADLHQAGLIHNPDEWAQRLGESPQNWLNFVLIQRLLHYIDNRLPPPADDSGGYRA